MKLMTARLVATVFLLGLIPTISHAQDFAADVVYIANNKPNEPSARPVAVPGHSSKLYVSKDKMRLETHGLTGTILLVNGVNHTAVALYPAQKAYQQVGSAPSEYFRVEDAENACPGWTSASDQKIICEKVGHEVVGGRQTVKYQNKAASDAPAAVWIDLALKFVIKWDSVSNGAELRNISEAQQPADLFAVPSGYDVLKPLKRSSKGFSKRSR